MGTRWGVSSGYVIEDVRAVLVDGNGVPISGANPLPTSGGGGGSGGATEAKQDAQLAAFNLEVTQRRRFGGFKTPVVADVTGTNTTIYTPAAGKRIQLYWFSLTMANQTPPVPRYQVKLGSLVCYQFYGPMVHWEYFEGAVDAPLTVVASGANTATFTGHIVEV